MVSFGQTELLCQAGSSELSSQAGFITVVVSGYPISSVLRQSYFLQNNSKDLDPS